MQDPTYLVQLYTFKLTKKHKLTVSTHRQEVEATRHEMAETYKLQRRQGKDFVLADVLCFLQTDWTLPIPLEEIAALRECVYALALEAVKRLEHPTFTLLRDRDPILQCEMLTFTLCIRKEMEEQSEMLVQFWLNDRQYAWKSGHMTTETQTSVDLTITHGRDKNQSGSKYQMFRHMSELNEQGVFFCREGLGYAGKILVLPEEATPPSFRQVHIS
ncbi:hypothetical protein ABEF95_003331 [Exophiala dermatitidis]